MAKTVIPGGAKRIMKYYLMTLIAGLVIAAPAGSATKSPPSSATSSFFLQCSLSNASIKENQTVENQTHDYTFEVSVREGQIRDLILSGFPFTISKASSGRIDAVNKSALYARSLTEGAESANLTINRVTGATDLWFFTAPKLNEVKACESEAQSRGDTGWYCKDSPAVARHSGICSPVKPRF